MLIVDPATGAMYNLPDRVDISLDADTALNPTDSLNIATIDLLTLEQKELLVKI